MDAYAKVNKILVDSFGLGAKRYQGSAVNELEPALHAGLAGGWHYDMDSHLRPDKLVQSLRTVLLEMGVTMHEQTKVRGFAHRGQTALA